LSSVTQGTSVVAVILMNMARTWVASWWDLRQWDAYAVLICSMLPKSWDNLLVPFFKSQAVQSFLDCLMPEDMTDRLFKHQ
jgi:hypothetical protein